MCGISALIAPKKISNPNWIEGMTDIIKHRGPDGFGYFREDQVHLGHRRLAILDCSEGGHQPMHFESKTVLTYNGEIYNYLELRAELQEAGYTFQSQSDTEVILAAYDFWKEDCLRHFNGMWSFVLFDKKQNKIFAARDRFGVKPLYYWTSPEGLLAFGSEIKQFTTLPGWTAVMNAPIAAEFISSGLHDHSEETFFKGVHQVLPGHFLSLNLNDFELWQKKTTLPASRWYQLPNGSLEITYETAVAQVRETLKSAVQFRLRSDVPVGSCLSGGIDSSSIVSLMAEELSTLGMKSTAQKTFSALSEDPTLDEGSYMREVAVARQTDHHTTTPQFEELWKQLDLLTWHQDEPFGSSSIYAQWCVFKLAREQGCLVMLDGQGADEQLAGYPEFVGAGLAELLTNFRLIDFVNELQALKRHSGLSYVRSLVRTLRALFPQLARYLQQNSKRRIDASRWIPAVPGFEPVIRTESSVAALSRSQVEGLHLQMLLRYEDRDSMAHSVEARVPFLDYRFVELATRLPSDFRIKAGLTKRVLRDAMHGIVPPRILDRTDKIGFATAESRWMNSAHSNLFRQELASSVANSCGFLNAYVSQDFERMLRGELPYSTAFWRAISIARWIKVFNVKVQL